MLIFGVVPTRPYPWLYGLENPVLLSAFYIVRSCNKVEELLGELRERNVRLVIDSGGYQILNRKILHELDMLKTWYRFALTKITRSGVQILYALQLDIPPSSGGELLSHCVDINVKLFEECQKIGEELSVEVVPIIHGPADIFRRYIELHRDIFKGLDFIALGGLVPYARRRPYVVADWITDILAKLEARNVHLLGLFMPTLLPKLINAAKQLGVNVLIDYAGWRRAAATGMILTPWGYRKVTSIGQGRHVPRLQEGEISYAMYICSKIGLTYDYLAKEFEARAIFNMYSAAEIWLRSIYAVLGPLHRVIGRLATS